ncbi:DUF116 domain-containing protein [archaeon]|nr:MAG: DUF116 domain-containing protein [archaeon]
MSPFTGSFFQLVGEIVVYLFLVLLILVVIGLMQFLVSLRVGKFIFPSFLSFLVDTFNPIFKKVFELLRLEPSVIDELDVSLKNNIHKRRFSDTSVDERLVVLPQCLRSINCPAKLSAKDGISCQRCGKCTIDQFMEQAETLGYHVFIVPGGTFVRRIIANERPRAVLGVGCATDLLEGMQTAQHAGIAVQGVLLDTTGCIETCVKWDKIYDKLYLGLDQR